MVVRLAMPQLGESVTEGTVARWLKREGEGVAKYEPLLEVITDKVNTEIPAPVEGVLARIAVAEGETVPVGTELAVIEPKASTPERQDLGSEVQAAAPTATAWVGERAGAGVHEATESPGQTDGAGEPQEPAAHARHATSPLVRRIAREHSLNLSQIRGTGLGGRVTKQDVEAFLAQRVGAEGAAPPASVMDGPRPAPAPAPASQGEVVVPLTPMRRAIALNMTRSVQTIPHAWTVVEADVTALVRWREAIKEEFRRTEGVELTYLPFAIKALVEGVKQQPWLNATWRDSEDGGGIVLKRRINVGVAVGLDDGLVVPVIHDADQKSIPALARALHDLVHRARSGQLKVEDVQGGTITVNNTGAFGSVISQPIIVPGQAAILTLEAIQPRPVAVGDAIAVRSIAHLCLSFDHRVADGVQVGRFMQVVMRTLEAFGPETPLYQGSATE